MKVLVIGNGAREHAIGHSLKKSPKVSKLFFAQGNAGTAEIGENIDIKPSEINKLLDFALKNKVGLTVIGPEDPLCLGISDLFEQNGLRVFGVSKASANLEGSKAYAKEFMIAHNIDTAKYIKTENYDDTLKCATDMFKSSKSRKVVLKADGLCQGKGVLIAESVKDIEIFCKEVFSDKIFGDCDMVIEEFLEGFEVSLLCFVDNKTIKPMPTAKDHKKIFDGERGPNTGGMGTYSPNVQADVYLDEMMKNVAEPFLKGVQKDNLDFRGIIFFGLMITEDGIKVLEFNTRFGDPETQSILLRLETDLFDIFDSIIDEKLSDIDIKYNDKKVISLVLASGGYPKDYVKDYEITNLSKAKCTIFHAGTGFKDGKVVTKGGRVLTVSSACDSFLEAYNNVISDAEIIEFVDKQFRRDISPLVHRVYVEKKEKFDVLSPSMLSDIKESLQIDVENLKIYQRYDIENITEGELEKISKTILSENPVDNIYINNDAFALQKTMVNPLVIKYHDGQFDQRKQGLIEAIAVSLEKQDILAKSEMIIDFKGQVTPENMKKIEEYLINPVDQEKGILLSVPTTLKEDETVKMEEKTYDGFIKLSDIELKGFLAKLGLAMNFDDLKFIQEYFIKEQRDPTETEIAMIDTYWSDHCRHTTFFTTLENVKFEKSDNLIGKTIQDAYNEYLDTRAEIGRTKDINLMDLGTIVARYMKAKDMLSDLEVTSENNACSVKVKVKTDEEVLDYLLMFKNETHNHPTEVEPFGGASTCLGGAIRDPLSGRSYVYQAMRVTGASDPRESVLDTLEGKLPQRKIVQNSAKGYSSYGNQIGLATGHVDEIYHEGYKAKRMEVGAVIAAVPEKNVRREEPANGDVILLIGGRTGRDGIGGATGSSKEHTEESIKTSSAEVQKGNAPIERRLQRLFRHEYVSKMIKKCNDFGAGGVSVAIGELADSLVIRLEDIKLKYRGLTPKEIAISESQERMAVVIEKKDIDAFFKACYDENLEVSYVADVTDSNRLVMKYNDLVIVDISRDFLNSSGAKRSQNVIVDTNENTTYFDKIQVKDVEQELLKAMTDLNIASKKELIENFDSSIGRNTVLVPLGGKNQITPTSAMVCAIPTEKGNSQTASIMSYGFNPYLSEQSQFMGAYYAVVESLCKVASTGADPLKSRLSFQEYFERLSNDDKKWGSPLKSLLGAFKITKDLCIPPIGGKDSMSGTFKDITVPPTLISFAVTTEEICNIISPEFKGNSRLGIIKTDRLADGTLNLGNFKHNLAVIREQILSKNIISAQAVSHKGIAPQVLEMSFGSDIGFEISLENTDIFAKNYGDFIVEYKKDFAEVLEIGSTNTQNNYVINGKKLEYSMYKNAYLNVFNDVFSKENVQQKPQVQPTQVKKEFKSKKPVNAPKVLIPVFSGTNCEFDSKIAFDRCGAQSEIVIFNNLTVDDIKKSIDTLCEKIRKSQILFIPGGFSLSDEPDGSGKFIATVLTNEKVKAAIEYMLSENDGLILGICNGFQALIKTGLLPYGKISEIKQDTPTLTHNKANRHIARIVDTKLSSNNSPWLKNLDFNATYKVPISHGEGRFVCSEEWFETLHKNGQIAFSYIDNPNNSDYNIEGIVSPCGKILGKMAHTERLDERLYKNIPDVVMQDIFQAGVDYFKK